MVKVANLRRYQVYCWFKKAGGVNWRQGMTGGDRIVRLGWLAGPSTTAETILSYPLKREWDYVRLHRTHTSCKERNNIWAGERRIMFIQYGNQNGFCVRPGREGGRVLKFTRIPKFNYIFTQAHTHFWEIIGWCVFDVENTTFRGGFCFFSERVKLL